MAMNRLIAWLKRARETRKEHSEERKSDGVQSGAEEVNGTLTDTTQGSLATARRKIVELDELLSHTDGA